ncbi:hypothetical protein K445DRAFT_24572 [Daldinia sp. EC12]|nr:hypothetical protein K445DRAFT_24572 [Daldinia sp. EC12]
MEPPQPECQSYAESKSESDLPPRKLLLELKKAIEDVLRIKRESVESRGELEQAIQQMRALASEALDHQRRQPEKVRYASPESIKNLTPPMIELFEYVSGEIRKEIKEPGSVKNIYKKATEAYDRMLAKERRDKAKAKLAIEDENVK